MDNDDLSFTHHTRSVCLLAMLGLSMQNLQINVWKGEESLVSTLVNLLGVDEHSGIEDDEEEEKTKSKYFQTCAA